MQEREARELETKIAAWRARMSAALPGQEETVRELESHLRDHIEVKTRGGMAADAAFEEGVKRMGEPRAVAREFARMDGAGERLEWSVARPAVVIYGLTGSLYAALIAYMVWRWSALGMQPLLAAHTVAIAGGYLAVLTAGLLGAWTLVASWRRVPPEREVRTQRREIFRMTAVGSVLVPLGVVLGMAWAHGHLPGGAWSWAPVEIGAACVWASTWLLLLVQLRVIPSERVRALLMVLGAAVVLLGWFAKGLTPVVPAGWLGVALILSQGAIAWLHVRSKRAAEEREQLV